ncbi:MAG: hypothetical protein QOD98_3821 [Nocardioidaceae bacterium]|jgi:hypothetical protein|nr:hypothetical protein [Nocardioidaceae bacterium]
MALGSMRGRGAIVVLVAAVTLLIGGGAIAYWRAAGGGSGAETTGTTAAVTLSPATPTAALFPGGQTSVVLTVTNPNLFSVRVGSLALDTGQGSSGFDVDGAHTGCALAILSFATQTNAGAGWTVAASGNLSVTLTNALSMTSAAASSCQGASFTVYLVAGP